MALPLGIFGSAACKGQQRALHVDVEGLVELSLLDLSERSKLAAARVGEQDVDATLRGGDDLDDACEVGRRRDVTTQGLRAVTDLGHCGIEFGLPPPGDEDFGTFAGESLRRGQTQAGAAAGDKRHLAGVLAGMDVT